MEFKYEGRGISLNEAMGSNWQRKYEKKMLVQSAMLVLLQKREDKDKVYNQFKLSVRYNGNFDIDNTVATAKIFVDCLRSAGMAVDDTKEYYRGICLSFDDSLPKPTYIFTIEDAN